MKRFVTYLLMTGPLFVWNASADECGEIGWYAVSQANGISAKFEALPSASVSLVKVNGSSTVPDTLQAIYDGNPQTEASVSGCSKGMNNTLIFKLDESVSISGLQCIAPAAETKKGYFDIGEFAIYVSDRISEWGEPVRRGIFNGSNPFVSFTPKCGRYVKLVFSPISWAKGSDVFEVWFFEITIYRSGMSPQIDGLSDEQSRLIADGNADSRISIKCPAEIKLSVNSKQPVSGVALLVGAAGPINANIQILAQDTPSGEMRSVYNEMLNPLNKWRSGDECAAQSLFFDPVQTDSLVLKFSGNNSASFDLCEVDWLTQQKMNRTAGRCDIHIWPDKAVRTINPDIFGANIEFWLDDDAVLNDEHFARRIKQTGITLLRYPGGTESDLYLWKEHRLINTNYWPFIDGPGTTDTDEMMAFAKKTGTKVILCANTEYAFYEKDWEKGAANAADWVRYCKKNGYPVKYWSIGNETYWKFRFGAKEYAQLVRLYATKMKEADPDIIISAVGDEGINFVGAKDTVTTEGLRYIEELQDKFESGKLDQRKYSAQLTELRKKYANPNPDLWWPTVFQTAGDLIDMAEIHLYSYYPQDTFMTNRYQNNVREIKEYAEKKTGRPCAMAVTEWNLNSWGGVGKDSKGIEQALYIGEFLGRLIEAGVDAATFWPITMQGNWAQKAFFVEKHLDIQPSQIGFALCSRNLCGQLVRSSSSSDAYYTIASHDSGRNETTLLIYGRPLVEAGEFTEVSVDLSGEAFAGAVCSRIEVYYAAQKQSYSIQRLAPRFEQQGGKLRFMLPRYAMAAVKISHR